MGRQLFTRIVMGVFLAWLSGPVAIAAGPEGVRPSLDPDFARFAAEKRDQAKRLGKKHEVTVPEEVWQFFDAVQKGDWEASSNQFNKIEAGSARKGGTWMPAEVWGPVHETYGAYEQFHTWDLKLLHRFGERIIQSVPAGSIYFGGTDAGRFVVSALCASHVEARPFFTVTQNALADSSYLNYLRDFYGDKINIPTLDEAQQAFNEFLKGARERLEKKELREGEQVEIKEGRIQVSGLMAVMDINGLLVRTIVDKNPSREIYLEESYALTTLYGQSLPHGLIFKVNHQPLEQVPESAIEADHRFWSNECRALIGEVVREKTTVPELCSGVERLFSPRVAPNSGADPAYLKDSQAPVYFSKCRGALAGYYVWWSKKSEKSQAARLVREADFAHRQAVALAPYSPTIVWRYADFLLQNQRTNDAKILIATALKLDPEKRMDIDSDELKGSLKKLRAEAKRLGASAGSQ